LEASSQRRVRASRSRSRKGAEEEGEEEEEEAHCWSSSRGCALQSPALWEEESIDPVSSKCAVASRGAACAE